MTTPRHDDEFGPGRGIKERLFEKYFKPLLKRDPDPQNQTYIYDAAWRAWQLDFGPQDAKAIALVEWMCGRLVAGAYPDFSAVLIAIFEEQHDANERLDKAERRFSAAEGEEWFVAALDLYKLYFESEFRLWGTVPFLFVCSHYKTATAPASAADAIHVGGGEKFQAIKKTTVALPQGDPNVLIAGFDNEVRNAGAGHDRWEFTDSGNILLNVRDPKTGKPKGSEQIELTAQDLRDLIKQCRKTTLILTMGLVVYMVNNPGALVTEKRAKPFKRKEIEDQVATFSRDRCLRLRTFACDEKRTQVALELQHVLNDKGSGGEILFGNGERFEVINVESDEQYSLQIFGILQYLLQFFDQKALPAVTVTAFDRDGKKIGSARFDGQELGKLLTRGQGVPKASEGALPAGTYAMRGELKVPYGMRKAYEERLRASLPPNGRIV